MEKFDIKSFLEKLSQMKALSPIWQKVLDTLPALQSGISDEALAFFAIYFSRLDDGNICIPLEENALIQKWNKKWEGLLLIERKIQQKQEDKIFFEKIIKAALPQINTNKLPELITSDISDESKPFIIDSGWLFAAKYYRAKRSIEDRIKELMQQKDSKPSAEEIKKVQDYFYGVTLTKKGKHILLNEEQAEAIIRGKDENLIITGGPGTGKTTVVCYLLWELLKDEKYSKHHIYLTAPSGKAQDRLKESITSSLEDFIPEEQKKCQEIFDRLNTVEAYTIHRLLSYNPATNNFIYNDKNPFKTESIFVIDEASMIDITLFSSLLEAIPKDARVFILGDKDQLPSVQAGAVLGELLAKKTDSVVELVISNRFAENSAIGQLKNAMQKDDEELSDKLLNLTTWENWKNDKKNCFCIPPEDEYPVTTFIPEKKYKEQKEQIEDIIQLWSKTFYASLVTDVSLMQGDFSQEQLENLWDKATMARILCAERDGLQGVNDINKKICKEIIKSTTDDYFPGQILILTKNQTMFSLYNGDSGIVIEKDNLKYLMIKKEAEKESSESGNQEKKSGIFREGNFIFYPLYLLPKESIESAYAITIHKSQGSGYPAILVFLPSQKGHPLLNRQIAYTAITRTKGSTYIYADKETMETARATVIQRDTRIELHPF